MARMKCVSGKEILQSQKFSDAAQGLISEHIETNLSILFPIW